MDNLRDLISLLGDSLEIALVVVLVPLVPYFLLLRAIPAVSRFRQRTTWRSDLKPIGIAGAIVFSLVLVFSLAVGGMSADMCGTGDVTEAAAPNNRHKIVVYNFDCGATTDFSLDVSLLRGDEKLPKHHVADLLYSHYHQRPTASGPDKNFQVDWIDPGHVTVQVAQYTGEPQTRHQDGVDVTFQPLP